jgi:hypothetical protein
MMRKIFIALLFVLASSAAVKAQQVIYSQTFEDTASLFQDYVLSNIDKADPIGTDWDTLQSVAWFVSVAGTSGNHAAVATSNYAGDTAANDWFITPAIRLGEHSILTFKSLSMVAGTTDTYEVFVSTTEQSVTGCLFNGPLWHFTSSQSVSLQEQIPLDLAAGGYANQNVYIGFRLTTASGGDRLAIDDITVTETVTHFQSLTFKVNMANYIADSLFFPGRDTVDIAGTFNNFEGTKHILSMVPGTDSSLYAITIPGFLPGDRLEFKFRINSSWDDSIAEFPYGLPNRVWVVEPGKYTYTCDYNDQGASSGIPENGLMNQVSIYPNPAHSQVAIEIPDGIMDVLLVSLTGNKILGRETQPGHMLNLEVSTLTDGTYLLLFYTKQGFAGSKKLIKN